MSDNDGDAVSKAVVMAAAVGAGFLARKVLIFGWKKVTGKEPPTDVQDPAVGFAEALSWAVVLGVGIQAARMVAARVVTKKMRRPAAGEIQE
jgi:Protein of unknown function (DUF4235)